MRETSLVKNQSKLTFDTRGSALYNYKKTKQKETNKKTKQNKTKKICYQLKGAPHCLKFLKVVEK